MTGKKNRPAQRTAHDDPWAPGPRPDVPAAYTAAISAAVIRCQHCNRPVGLAETPATAPAVTCTTCMRRAVGLVLGPDEPPF